MAEDGSFHTIVKTPPKPVVVHTHDITKGLMMHCGSALVDRAQAMAVPVPPPTATHFPISHGMLIEVTTRALIQSGFHITQEVHALWGGGVRYFGIFALAPAVDFHSTSRALFGKSNAWTHCLGLRSSHDKSFASQGLLGTFMPLICDNLCWSGGNVFKFTRKATKYIKRDIEGVIWKEIAKLGQRQNDLDRRYQRYQDYKFTGTSLAPENVEDGAIDYQHESIRRPAYDFFIRAMKARAIPTSKIRKVVHEWERPDGPAGCVVADAALYSPTAYRMMNAFTAVERNYPSLLEGPRRNARLTGLLDAETSFTMSNMEDFASVE